MNIEKTMLTEYKRQDGTKWYLITLLNGKHPWYLLIQHFHISLN